MTVYSNHHTPNLSARTALPIYIVIHRMQGYFDYTVNELFPSAASEVSADRCMSKDGRRVAIFNHAASKLKTWAVGDGNSYQMSIETEGFVGDEGTLGAAFFDCLADQVIRIAAEIKATYGVEIPMRMTATKGQAGIVGHHQVAVWYGGSDHSCPGDFPFLKLIAAIHAKLTPDIVTVKTGRGERFRYVVGNHGPRRAGEKVRALLRKGRDKILVTRAKG